MGSQMLEMLEAARPLKLQLFTMQHQRPWAARQPDPGNSTQWFVVERSDSPARRKRASAGSPFAARRVPLPPLPTGMRHPAELASEALGRGDQSADAIWGDGGS